MARAARPRLPYADVPTTVRRWVDDVLGSPVVATTDHHGGMSPGCATTVCTADGSTAFVKAVGAELNPDTPALYRHEITVHEAIGHDPLWAGLRTSYDENGWVALILDPVDGSTADLRDDEVLAAALHATDKLTDRLGQTAGDGLPSFGDRVARWRAAFDHRDLLPVWTHQLDLTGVADLLATEPGAQVAHFDIRDDNLLVTPTGSVVFVDWGMAIRGPTWLDPMMVRLERVEDAWFDASLEASPHLRGRDELITAFLLLFGSWLAYRACTAVDVNLPTMQEFRRRESTRLLGAARRRLEASGDLGRSGAR